MIKYWSYENALEEIQKDDKKCWINVVCPSDEEIKTLTDDYNISHNFLEDLLNNNELSRIEFAKNNILIIVRVPAHHNLAMLPYYTITMGIIIKKNGLITITNDCPNEVLNELRKPNEFSGCIFKDQNDFLIKILYKISLFFAKYLKEINTEIGIIEKKLQTSTKNEEVTKIFKLQKSLIYFSESLKSNLSTLENIKKYYKKLKLKGSNLHDIDNIIKELNQSINVTNIYINIQSSMLDSFASIISNNLSMIMKQLSSITIIIMIPTLITSIYGMNLKNNIEGSVLGFYLVVGLSLLISIIVGLIFKKKNYF